MAHVLADISKKCSYLLLDGLIVIRLVLDSVTEHNNKEAHVFNTIIKNILETIFR